MELLHLVILSMFGYFVKLWLFLKHSLQGFSHKTGPKHDLAENQGVKRYLLYEPKEEKQACKFDTDKAKYLNSTSLVTFGSV